LVEILQPSVFNLKTWVVTVFLALDFRGISDKDIDGCYPFRVGLISDMILNKVLNS